MDERDIFDEEYDRINGQQSDFNSAFNNWSNHNTPPQQPKQNKSLRIVLTAVLMVFCLVFGWALGSVTSTSTTPSTGDVRKDVLDSVIDFMDYNFYQDIDEETWQMAVEQAGVALLQYAGDQFTFLMSPQSYYDYLNSTTTTATAASNMGELFGITYSMADKGMTVSSVSTDSAVYGNLYKDDLIVKLSNIQEYQPIRNSNGDLLADINGNMLVKRDANGKPITIASASYPDGYVLEGKTTTEVGKYLMFVYSATFHVLRDGEIQTVTVARNAIGINEKKTEQKRYDFNFVEYYFSDDVTNVSITNQNGAATNTKTERGLDNLPNNTGYIHLTQFDETSDKETCYTEMKTAMELFAKSGCKRLVLDLKGNPGGYVNLAVNIAGLFIGKDNLSANDLNKVTTDVKSVANKTTVYGDGLLVTTLTDRNGYNQSYKIPSSYRNYFKAEDDDNKKRIIVWTDGGSASASELLTGTLLDYGTAVQMGTKSYGKGIAQTIETLNITGSYIDINGIVHSNGNWAVYYTFAKYYSPLGKNIHGEGYTPIADYTASTYADLVNLANTYWAE